MQATKALAKQLRKMLDDTMPWTSSVMAVLFNSEFLKASGKLGGPSTQAFHADVLLALKIVQDSS